MKDNCQIKLLSILRFEQVIIFDIITSVVKLLFLELELITITLDLDMFKVSLFAIMYFSIAFISVLISTLRSVKFLC